MAFVSLLGLFMILSPHSFGLILLFYLVLIAILIALAEWYWERRMRYYLSRQVMKNFDSIREMSDRKKILALILIIITASSIAYYAATVRPPIRAAVTGSNFDNIVIIAMENQNYADVLGTGTGSSNAPFLGSLLPMGATIPNYHSYGARSTISGCSASCYTTFMSGSCCVSDGYGTINVPNLMNPLFSNVGLTWKAFCESGCPRGNDHFPFTAFSNIQTSPNIIITSVAFTSTTNNPVLTEMNSVTPSNLVWLTPTDSHNMHDNSIQTGDAYLKQLLVGTGTVSSPSPGSLYSTSLLKSGRTLLYIWWDEYDPSPNLLLGSNVKKGFISTANNYDEYDSLRTIESNWNLPTITANDAAAPVMSDLFGQSAFSTGFSFAPSNPQVGQTITFTGTASGGTSPFTFSWTFGDSSTGAGATVTHVYSTAATFTVTLTAKDSSTTQQTAIATQPVIVVSVPTYPNCGIPLTATTDQVVGGGTLATGSFTPGIPDKRSTSPPCSVNSNGMFIKIFNVTLTNIANGATSQDCNLINGLTYCDSTADAQSLGSTHALHIEIDQAWKAAGIAPSDFPTNGSRIDITGFAYWDLQTTELHWEMHPVSSWSITAKPTPPGNFDSAWFINNCDGAGTGTEKIVNGVLQLREQSPGGNDNNYGYCTTQRGTFPWGATQGTALPSGITSVSSTVNFLLASLTSGSRYHLFIALYYQLPTGTLCPTGGIGANGACWLDTQSRVVWVNGAFEPIGTAETYTSQALGYGLASTIIMPGQTGTITANVASQCQADLAAWGLPTSTACALMGVEIGTEGFQFTELDTDWTSVTLATGAAPKLLIDFTFSPTNPQTGQTVTFTSSTSGGTTPYTNTWAFGDGSTGTGATTTHAYSTVATFTVTLTTKDTSSPIQTVTVSKTITVTSPIPMGTFTISWQGFDWDGGGEVTISLNGGIIANLPTVDSPQNAQVYAPFSVTTSKVVTGTNTLLFTHANWDCSVVDNVKNLQVINSTGFVVFSDPTIRPLSCTQSITYTFAVGGAPPPPSPLTANFSFSPVSPTPGQTVTFTATVSGGVSPYTFSWTFGDGTTGTGSSITHVYSIAGTFTVILKVTDSQPTSVTASKTITVAFAPLTANFSFSPTSPTTGQTVTFTGTATGGKSPYTFAWNFNDGTTATGATVTHVFTAAFDYNVTLTVTDSQPVSVSVTKVVSVSPPSSFGASFTWAPLRPHTRDTVTFTATVTGGVGPFTFTWNFGDGSTGTGNPATHQYASKGVFTVTLTVTDSIGETVTITRQITIRP